MNENKRPIKIDAAFIPKEVCTAHDPVCILIDAVRASCTIATFFDMGAREMTLVESEERYVETHKDSMLENDCICAENLDGSCAPLAEVSPSIEDIRKAADYQGRRVFFRTTNGTIGVRKLGEMKVREILIGSMINCDAVAKAAVDLAMEKGMNICTVCAGREHGDIYCIDDTYCAGILIQRMEAYANSIGCPIAIQDSGKIALALVSSFGEDDEAAYCASASGDIMRNIHKEIDLHLCSRRNVTQVVPRVTGIDDAGNVTLTI